jgi:hypothetical protein
VNCSRTDNSQLDHFAAASSPLAKVLFEAAVTIQYHAKWFAPDPLSTLFQLSLRLASRSTSTPDLYGALALIDAIATYSYLPTLLPAVRFVALAYYQGSRSNRHKRLSQSAWAVAQHLLESHLGGQFVGHLLDIISDLHHSESRKQLGTSIGALMLTAQKLLPIADGQASAMQPTQILLGLEKAVVDDAMSCDQIATVLSAMLLDDRVFEAIEHDGSLGLCLKLCERFAGPHLDQSVADDLFKGLGLRSSSFEARHQPSVARLHVDNGRPLPPDLSKQLLLPWRTSIFEGEQTLWNSEYRALLSRLCTSSLFLEELDSFIDTAVLAFFRFQSVSFRKDLVNVLEKLIMDPQTEDAPKASLSLGLLKIFTHNMQKAKWEDERKWLFPILCRLSPHCVNIAEFLFRIRADASNEGYVDASPAGNDQHSEVSCSFASLQGIASLSVETWVRTVHDFLTSNAHKWEVYNIMLTGMAAQVRNHALWTSRPQLVNLMRHAVCNRLSSDSFMEPPEASGTSKSYIVCRLLQILAAMMSYHKDLPPRDIKAAIATFVSVAGSRDYTVSIECIHALTICCYELPEVMADYMDVVVSKMSKMVTQRHLAMYVLEFLAGLSRLPLLYEKLDTQGLKRVFGVCHSYLQTIRGTAALEGRKRTPTSISSAGASSSTSSDDMAQYVYALTHHVITFWYMALKRSDRHALKPFISNCLRYTDADGVEHIEDQGIVTIDMMDRVDAEEGITAPAGDAFDELDGRVVKRHRLTGLLLITTETALRTSKTIITIRRPSGTAQRTIASTVGKTLVASEEDDDRLDASTTVENNEDYITVFDDDILGRTYGKVFVPGPSSALGANDIITLSEDDPSVRRAIDMFDRTSALDSHKVGVIYVGEGQTTEEEMLLNQSGSPDYREWLNDLGSLRRLKKANFNSQGLDRSELATDGEHTIVWNNSVTELVYHITTFMPLDPSGDQNMTVIRKKSHIGNDFVNIIFNNSGAPFRFDTFPSDFSYVYIVISPAERTSFLQARTTTSRRPPTQRFYNVRVLARPGYPNLSSATDERVVSGASLGAYVRNLALNSCVFSAMWNADDVGEYPSSWRRRLHMLRRLADQHRPASSLSAAAPQGQQHQHFSRQSKSTTNSAGTGANSLMRPKSMASSVASGMRPRSMASSSIPSLRFGAAGKGDGRSDTT